MLLKKFREMVANMNIYTNVYVVADEVTKEGIVIDPGGAVDKVYNYIENMEIKLKYIILTHCHADHTAGLSKLNKYYPNAKILIHEDDSDGLTNSEINMCETVGVPNNYLQADVVLKDGDEVTFGNLKAKIIHTPGHTKGGICILINDALFTGDTLFKRLYGRTDLPTGSEEKIQKSIQKIFTFDENTIIYPGHGAISIIREEKEHYKD